MVDYNKACSEAERKIMEKWGYSILMNTDHCVQYLSEHNNDCTGCISSLGCAKLMCLSLNTFLFIEKYIEEKNE